MKRLKNSLIVSVIAAMTICIYLQGNVMNVQATNKENELRTGACTMEEEVLLEGDGEWNHEELFETYVESILYEEDEHQMSYGAVGSERLTGRVERELYDTLKARIMGIASGQITNTKISFDVQIKWTAAELGAGSLDASNCQALLKQKMKKELNFSNVLSYLLMDCPYELYWFDKTVGTLLSYSFEYNSKSVMVTNIEVSMPVAVEYQGYAASYDEKLYTLDGSMIASVERARDKAKSIVEETKYLSRYERLVAFKDSICELTDYNDAAVTDPNPDYGNPWQMIWVFDEKSYTDVVCEGYSKAFQYLCDLAGFTCYTVDGMMTSGTGSGGPHMWNVVTFGGKNYLVDITNCDSGTIGYPDKLFMAGTDEGGFQTGYIFPELKNLKYTYSDNHEDLFGGSVLTLATKSFDSSIIAPLEVSFVYERQNVLYKKQDPKIEGLQILRHGVPVENAEITYFYRYHGSSVNPVEGLPRDVGTFEIKAVAEGDLYQRTESSNLLLLTIEDSVANTFSDIYGYEWHFEYIQSVYDSALMTGISGTDQFSPDMDITKAQVAQVLYNMEQKPQVISGAVFQELSDVYSAEWYAAAVAWAYNEGIITGDLYTKTFSPNASVLPLAAKVIVSRECAAFYSHS